MDYKHPNGPRYVGYHNYELVAHIASRNEQHLQLQKLDGILDDLMLASPAQKPPSPQDMNRIISTIWPRFADWSCCTHSRSNVHSLFAFARRSYWTHKHLYVNVMDEYKRERIREVIDRPANWSAPFYTPDRLQKLLTCTVITKEHNLFRFLFLCLEFTIVFWPPNCYLMDEQMLDLKKKVLHLLGKMIRCFEQTPAIKRRLRNLGLISKLDKKDLLAGKPMSRIQVLEIESYLFSYATDEFHNLSDPITNVLLYQRALILICDKEYEELLRPYASRLLFSTFHIFGVLGTAMCHARKHNVPWDPYTRAFGELALVTLPFFGYPFEQEQIQARVDKLNDIHVCKFEKAQAWKIAAEQFEQSLLLNPTWF